MQRATLCLGAALLVTAGGPACGSRKPKKDRVTRLLAELSGADRAKRQAAVRQLATIQDDPRLLRPFVKLLFDRTHSSTAISWFEAVGEKAIGASASLCAVARGKIPAGVKTRKKKPDKQLRKTAIGLLGKIGGPRAIDTVVALLGDPDYSIRQRVKKAIRKIGIPAIPALVRQMAHGTKAGSRADLVVANWHPTPITALLKAARTPCIKARARVLSTLRQGLTPAVTAHLLSELKHPHWQVRVAALNALHHPRRRLGAAQLATVRKLLDDPDIDARIQAVELLTARKDRQAEAKLLALYGWRPTRVPGYVYAWHGRHVLDRLHSAIARGLIALGSKKGFDALLERLQKEPVQGDYFALGQSRNRRALEPLVRALKRVPYDSHKASILQALGTLGFKEARPTLEGYLTHPKKDVRWAAVRALSLLEDPAAVPALLRMLKDEQGEVVSAALHALEKIAAPAVIAPVCRLLNAPKADRPSNRVMAVRILAATKSAKATPCLLKALANHEADARNSPYSELRRKLLETLAKIGDDRAVEPLIQRLGKIPPPPKPRPSAPGRVAPPRTTEPIVVTLRRLAKRFPAKAAQIQQALARRSQ